MRYRPYFRERTTGKAGEEISISPERAWDNVVLLFEALDAEGWFQWHLGYYCVDAGHVPGQVKGDVELYVYRRTLIKGLWPPSTSYPDKNLQALFTLIEFLHDHVAEPTKSYYHSFSSCGIHVSEADPEAGRDRWREEVNQFLGYVDEGYELSSDGEVQLQGDREVCRLWETSIPSIDTDRVDAKIDHAIRQFRRGRASWDERRQAVRELADVLEFLRNDARARLRSKDESDLFQIANRFALRHNDQKQKGDYDPKIWLSWMFHVYLATCRALCEIRVRGEKPDPG